MVDNTDEMVTFRLGPKDRAAIQKLVEEGEFRNRSDFLRYAVKAGLREVNLTHAAARARSNDLDLEAVELPQHGEVARPRGARARRGVGQ